MFLRYVAAAIAFSSAITGFAQRAKHLASTPLLQEQQLADQYFGNDADWYLHRIPFLEIDDSLLQQIYYYRWQVFRSHQREIGEQGTDITEFLPDVPWARHPYTDLNDSSSFHILEGRWLRDTEPVTVEVDHLETGGGNDRHFSESIAAAMLDWVKVTGDPAPALRHLDTLQHTFNLWDDHFDATRGLYWIEPLLDATEYTISSIDASGAGFTDHPSTDQNRNGFTGGYAFRPSINSFQFANAEAIATFASLAGEPQTAAAYTRRAEALRQATLQQLWNPQLAHFTDVYQRSTPTVRAGDFIRGRELVGLVPWEYNLPPALSAPGQPNYAAAWAHALDYAQLGGAHGLRTVEPSYARYMEQYRYDAATGRRECQWNGPAWPFQTSEALTGMANLLQSPAQHAVTAEDYLRLLRQYARLHLNNGTHPDLQEDYNPDTGEPIVGLARSHHYLHSTFNDLLLSGLLGIRPRLDDTLELHPLIPTNGEHPIRFFVLQDLPYHGRLLTVLYDADGSRYHRGAGISVFSGATRLYGPQPPGDAVISLRAVTVKRPAPIRRNDLAVNVWERAPSAAEHLVPIAEASSTAEGSNPYEAIDGRLWFFPEIANGWSPAKASADAGDWISVDIRRPQVANSAELAFFAGDGGIAPPESLELQVFQAGKWERLRGQQLAERAPVANGMTHIRFPATQLQQVRLMVHRQPGMQLRLVELELFNDPAQSQERLR